MGSWALDNEIVVRVACFFGVFALLALLECVFPRRDVHPYRSRRWFTNLTIVVIDTIAVRIVFPLMAIDVALLAQEHFWGLFHHVELSYPVAVMAGVILLDFAIYLQHVMLHAIPLFWRIHRVHHADIDFDVTTGIRFHPLEILLSMGIKIGIVAAVGIPALAVLLFEVILNATSLFTHANMKLPLGFDRVLRWVIVTPDMHRVHHSVDRKESDTNFGFNLSIWDRLFGTYHAQPKAGHTKMPIGIKGCRDPVYQKLGKALVLPFIRLRESNAGDSNEKD